MPVLGGSPLGLIGVSSQPSRDGMSTFNAGKSRNFNVNLYNTGKGKTSIFTGGTRVNPWPNIKVVGSQKDPGETTKDRTMGIDETGKSFYEAYTRNTLHNNDVYDTSVLNIIEKLSFSKAAALRPSDFAYLKNLGVFPNNRLVIARKFLSAVGDDLNRVKSQPKSILISWKPESEDFLDISVGENWTEADADFTTVLNKIGEDFMGKGMGSKISAALNLVPLPGFTEVIQREVLANMGIMEKISGGLPAGNPNLIKMAKRRKTSGSDGQPFSGMKYEVSVKLTTEYEQKFISGIDPTVAFIDIIQNCLAFGTQDSTNYGLSGAFASKINKWANQPSALVKEFAQWIKKGLETIRKKITKAIKDLKDTISEQETEAEASKDPNEEKDRQEEEFEKQKKKIDEAGGVLQGFVNTIIKSLNGTIQKYREDLRGIAAALSGMPSTPYHVTIGNPLRPMFCSGDMYTDDVKITLGPVLAFNDLPTSIKVDLTLKPARPCGLQEIMAKFNTGNLRVVNVRRDQNQTENPLDTADYMYADPVVLQPDSNPNAANSQNVNNASSGSSGGTKENASQETTNRNANSPNPTNGSSATAFSGSSGAAGTSSVSQPATTSTAGTSGT